MGQTLQKGKYKIEKELGRGYFDVSYLARRLDSHERWVIKVLDSQLLLTMKDLERERLSNMFWQEAVKLAKCGNTPHIVRVEMPFEENGLVCLPIEHLQGNDLGSRPKPIVSEEQALKYIKQIGEALTIVHQQNLVHRNICPSNIFLRIQNDGQAIAVLTNFALAIDCDTELTRTRRHELVDGFSPIELYSRGKAVGFYTDVYSLAATLYNLLTGEMPPSIEKLKLLQEKRKNKKDAVSPQAKNPDISGATVRAIRSGMELNPDKRPQSMSDWLSQLEPCHEIPNRFDQLSKVDINWGKWQTILAVVSLVPVIWGVLIKLPEFINLRTPNVSPTQDEPSLIQKEK